MATASDLPVGGILASAFSEILGAPVVTYDEYQRQKEETPAAQFQTLDVDQIFRLSYDWCNEGEGEDQPQSSRAAEAGWIRGLSHDVENLSLVDEISVRVKTLNGYSHLIRVGERGSVRQLKEGVREKLGMPCEEQRLTFGGKLLDDDYKSISDYGVCHGSTLHMMMLSRGVVATSVIDNKLLLDPAFNFDFTKEDDRDKKFYRGGKRYFRPCGWQRFALKVKGKYENQEDGKNDKWLGQPGLREHSSEGEWPVSYHGTRKECTDSISDSGYLLRERKRSIFGIGIYSTPSIEIAADKNLYARPFAVGGKYYQLVFQNRVCPRGLKVIPESETGVKGDYWIQTEEARIRPYGFCVRPVTDF